VRRIWILLLLAGVAQAKLDSEVKKAFKRSDPDSRKVLLRGIRPLIHGTDTKERNRAAAAISKGLKGEEVPSVRMLAMDLLLELRTERALDRLVAAVHDRSQEVQQHVHEIVRDHADPKLHDAIVRALHEDASWRLRAAMVDLLLTGARESAKRPLLDALEDKHPAVAARAAEALERLTHKAFGLNRKKWIDYFARLPMTRKPKKETGETVSVADQHRKVESLKKGPILGLVPTLYTVPIRTKRVVFVVDMSSSMQKGLRSSHFVELKRAIFSLASDVQFNVLCFDERMFFFGQPRSLERATIAMKAKLERWINDLPAGQSTDVNRSVVTGLAMLKEALVTDPKAKAELFILTDGRETKKTTSLNAVERHYQKLPQDRCKVHVVALGKKTTPALKGLAERSNGRFVEVPR
jgi:hypothetical protein